MWVFCLHVYLCIICVPCAYGNLKRISDPLETVVTDRCEPMTTTGIPIGQSDLLWDCLFKWLHSVKSTIKTVGGGNPKDPLEDRAPAVSALNHWHIAPAPDMVFYILLWLGISTMFSASSYFGECVSNPPCSHLSLHKIQCVIRSKCWSLSSDCYWWLLIGESSELCCTVQLSWNSPSFLCEVRIW